MGTTRFAKVCVITPFSIDEVFKINQNFKITSFEDGILIIDDWYENFDSLHEIIQNMSVPRWKWDRLGKNFIDYYDCRPSIPFLWHEEFLIENINVLLSLCKKYFDDGTEYVLVNQPLEFNYFKHIKQNVSKNFQMHPHIDFLLNCIIYLDKICSGGTAIYDIKEHQNDEHLDLFYDVSNIPFKLIEAKPNRLVLFNGMQFHGGYISDHRAYENDWRINQVMFFDK